MQKKWSEIPSLLAQIVHELQGARRQLRDIEMELWKVQGSADRVRRAVRNGAESGTRMGER